MSVKLKNFTYKYDSRKTDGIKNLSINFSKGHITAIIGPSGSGKTTTLKSIAGLLTPQSGSIEFSEEQNISYIDQNSNQLNTNQSIFECLNTSLHEVIPDSNKRINQIRSTLALLEITNEIDSPISTLSGGQIQRLIIAKALVTNPTLLLLDEPFANLDKILRTQLLRELFPLFREKQITVIWVTHDTQESLAYSDQLVLLNYGELQQIGTPHELYRRPGNPFVATFFTQSNLIYAKLIKEYDHSLLVKVFENHIQIKKPDTFKLSNNNDILLVITPESIKPNPNGGFLKNKIDKDSIETFFCGANSGIQFVYNDVLLYAEISSYNPPLHPFNFDLIEENIYCLSV